jgi:hypothetical protein
MGDWMNDVLGWNWLLDEWVGVLIDKWMDG